MLAQIRALLIDLDGVMYRGEMPLPGALRVGPLLDGLGIAYAFVTNNATLTATQFAEKLGRMGVAVPASRVVTSGEATAVYLQALAPAGTTVCVVGEDGLTQTLEAAGFAIGERDAAFVVVGLDRTLTYPRLAAACLAIRRGARLIATNADPALPVEDGLWPGAGAILACITTATGAQPTVIGKPQPTLLRVALDRLGARPEETAIVGDRIDSDVLAGHAAGVHTILVQGDLALNAPLPLGEGGRGHPMHRGARTGEGAISPGAQHPIAPELTVRNLDELLDLLERAQAEGRASPLTPLTPSGEGGGSPPSSPSTGRGRGGREAPAHLNGEGSR